jgi:hypothetical protein
MDTAQRLPLRSCVLEQAVGASSLPQALQVTVCALAAWAPDSLAAISGILHPKHTRLNDQRAFTDLYHLWWLSNHHQGCRRTI